MSSKRLLRAAGLIAAFLFGQGAACAADENNSPAGLVVYSDMNFIESERDFVGLQVVVFPYSEGQKILWRSGSGVLMPPLLLDAPNTGDRVVKVVVPKDDIYPGTWTLRFKGAVVVATGPNGETRTLKRTRLK